MAYCHCSHPCPKAALLQGSQEPDRQLCHRLVSLFHWLSIMSKTLNTELPPEVLELCGNLSAAADDLDRSGDWPTAQLAWCSEAGVYRWFIPEEFGGFGWDENQILHGYLALSRSCLTTTFVLTQWNAACKRILSSQNTAAQRDLLPKMASGELFATVGISHLTTSRQHVSQPVCRAAPQSDGSFILDGYCPWVTGAAQADIIVLGATLPDSSQILAAVPAHSAGVTAKPGEVLVALTGSCTDQVLLADVQVQSEQVLAGPVHQVLQSGAGGGAGGLQTSTLAVGLALAASDFLAEQASRRPELKPIASKISDDCRCLERALVQLTAGEESLMTASELRQKANSLVLRCTQAALSAAKGAGFVATHPTGRWAREALFFLVWSCPQPVVAANLCELAQLSVDD